MSKQTKPVAQDTPVIPRSHHIFAEIIHWVTLAVAVLALFVPILILKNPDNNVLNPNALFSAIFSGQAPAQIWQASPSGAFPGVHYYLSYPACGDSFAMLLVVTAGSVGLIAGLPTALYQIFREKQIFYGILGLVLCALILLSMLGILG